MTAHDAEDFVRLVIEHGRALLPEGERAVNMHDRVTRVIANWASPDGSIWINAEERRDFDAELRWVLGRAPAGVTEGQADQNASAYRTAIEALPEGKPREVFRMFTLGYLSSNVPPSVWQDALDAAREHRE